ncbi:hypothetical protein C8R43DRAFT_1139429 [Mycena crocata]|nr:hypothetical protein C8R43DRAFT_1139429 [Mycena crocata]
MYTSRFHINDEPAPYLHNSAGFRSIVTRAWRFILDVEDQETRDLALSQIATLLPGMKPAADANLGEIIDAAGSVDHLAVLVSDHMQAMIDMAEKPMSVTDLFWIRAALDFVAEAAHLRIVGQPMYGDTMGRLGTSLATHDFVRVLVAAAQAVSESTEIMSLTKATLERCLFFLARIFVIPSSHHYLPSAISEGLLCALICAGHFDGTIQTHFDVFFYGILPRCLTSYYAVEALKEVFADAEKCASSTVFRHSQGFKIWELFWAIAKRSLHVFKMSEKYVSGRTCDNVECNTIRSKTKFRRCSGCLAFYYCSSECQISDWRTGGHRDVCAKYGTLRLSARNTPSVREREFLRYYIDAEYHLSKTIIYPQQVLCLQHFPNSPFFILFDYTSNGAADITVHAVDSDSPPVHDLRAYGAEWDNSVARARSSGGLMELHVACLERARAEPYYVLVPLRRAKPDIDRLLKELAAELPTELDDPKVEEAWVKFQPLLDAAEKEVKDTH